MKILWVLPNSFFFVSTSPKRGGVCARYLLVLIYTPKEAYSRIFVIGGSFFAQQMLAKKTAFLGSYTASLYCIVVQWHISFVRCLNFTRWHRRYFHCQITASSEGENIIKKHDFSSWIWLGHLTHGKVKVQPVPRELRWRVLTNNSDVAGKVHSENWFQSL